MGVFLIALVFSAFGYEGAGDVAQALGNLIGAAIGALGAGMIVVWELDRKRRDDAIELDNVRRSALRRIGQNIEAKSYDIQASIGSLVKSGVRDAALVIHNSAMLTFEIDPRFHDRLKEISPQDIRDADDLRKTNERLWVVASAVRGGTSQKYTGELAVGHLTDAMFEYLESLLRFLSPRLEGIDRGIALAENAKRSIGALLDGGLATPSALVRHGRINRPQSHGGCQ